MKRAIVWFRKDLRLHDNEALHRAMLSADEVILFYCFEETEFGTTSFGFKKCDSFRTQFLLESIENLKANIKLKGADLVIRVGNSAQHLKTLVNAYTVQEVYTTKEWHQEEMAVQEEAEIATGISFNYVLGNTLFHLNDLPYSFQEIPKVFTEFRKSLERNSSVRELYPEPEYIKAPSVAIDYGILPSHEDFGLERKKSDQRAAIHAIGGESKALDRLGDYFYQRNSLVHYKESRNELIGENYSSKFSLWLWNGCISPRKIYWELKKFESQVKKNESTYWLFFELVWRDFFKFISMKYGNSIFQLRGIRKDVKTKCTKDWQRFNQWAKGETGIPFVDANMKELNQTGYMSNRGRQNVASFLCHDLGVDWRMGAEYFESVLIDYDVASNYGNWMYIAGVGNDLRDRLFNIISQAKRYDSKGEYVKRWLPDLANLPTDIIHHPWVHKATLFHEGVSYSDPMVISDYWTKYY